MLVLKNRDEVTVLWSAIGENVKCLIDDGGGCGGERWRREVPSPRAT